VVDDGKISQALQGDLASGLDSLIDLTYKNGAPDNVTIVAARIGVSAAEITPTKLGAAL
jgi:serine/threonine protein phosphatase PrpC